MKGGPKNCFAYVTIKGKSGPGGRTCASAWSALLQSLARCQPQHIVAGERFH